MWKDKLVLIPGLFTLIVLLAGTALSVTALYGWHRAIHPEPQLDRSIGPVLWRTEGIAALVAVTSRREDAAALGFNAKVHGRDCSNFHRHLRRIAVGILATGAPARVWWRPRLTRISRGRCRPPPSSGCVAMPTRLCRCGRSIR